MWITGKKPDKYKKLRVDNHVDNVWIICQLSTCQKMENLRNLQISRVFHRISTHYPHVIHNLLWIKFLF